MDININEYAFRFTNETSNQIDEICKPLVEKFSIKNINFYRTYEDGKYLCLASGSMTSYMRAFMSEISSNGDYFSKEYSRVPQDKTHYYLWPEKFDGHLLNDPNFCHINKHNIWNGITLFQRGIKYVDTLNFSGTPEDIYLKSFFINNLKFLQGFMNYFIFSTKSILESAGPQSFGSYSSKVDLCFNDDIVEAVNDFQKYIKIQSFVRTPHNDFSVKLSNREHECAYYCTLGYSIKEIAIKLGISPRTVESYINIVKRKTCLPHKSCIRRLCIEPQ